MDNHFESSFVETPKQVAVIDSGYACDNDELHDYKASSQDSPWAEITHSDHSCKLP
ncbi:hypothetical protein [Candidatus Odyssella acanthamoebae]|uniref:hypothetical protein n=1 Tax=Candidatus Odyssella acanthamoebae TaxID=91604 RepID=UPI0012EBD550|nr:hypothetical protein [Candidatus Paracaedibacter acanthamoebae]